MLTTIEAALSGGVLLLARDGALRDMASMHGSYRKVDETLPALELIGQTLAGFGVSEALWLLDRPVSNSGRLKKIIEDLAGQRGWTWQVELVHDPDADLIQSDAIVATADSGILDLCGTWFNLARETVERHVAGAWVLDLGAAIVKSDNRMPRCSAPAGCGAGNGRRCRRPAGRRRGGRRQASRNQAARDLPGKRARPRGTPRNAGSASPGQNRAARRTA